MTSGIWAPPSPEQVEANIQLLRHLLGADFVDTVVEVTLTPKLLGLLHRLRLAEHPDGHVRKSFGCPVLSPPEVEAALLGATTPGGILDPSKVGGDVVWVMVIRAELAVDLVGASKLSRRWYAHLFRVAWEQVEEGVVHPLVFSVSAYSIAFVEHLRGREHEVHRWLREAHAHIEHEEPPELAVLAYLRACRLWFDR